MSNNAPRTCNTSATNMAQHIDHCQGFILSCNTEKYANRDCLSLGMPKGIFLASSPVGVPVLQVHQYIQHVQHTLTKSKPSLRRPVMTLSVDKMEYLLLPRAPEEAISARNSNATTSPTSTWYMHHQQRHPRAGTSLRHVRRKLPLALQQALESI